MAYEEIIYEVRERIATITLNRPDRLNAWTMQMDIELRDAVKAAAADEGVRVIILTGAGRGFCAGADMGNLSSRTTSWSSPGTIFSRLARILTPSVRFRSPETLDAQMPHWGDVFHRLFQ